MPPYTPPYNVRRRRRSLSTSVENEEIKDLKSKLNFLSLLSINTPFSSSDVVLVATASSDSADSSPIPAHRSVLMSRSPVFRAMLENEMIESISNTIKIYDVTHCVLEAFVNYLYTAEAHLDEILACDLLVFADKYQVEHLKDYCGKYIVCQLSCKNSLSFYAFGKRYAAKTLLDGALSVILDNMHKISEQDEYLKVLEEDPRLLVEIHQAHLAKCQRNKRYRRSTDESQAV